MPELFPDYWALLAADLSRYSALPSVQHASASQLIAQLIRQALTESGLGQCLRDSAFEENIGDGYVIAFPPRYLPAMLPSFLDALENALARHNRQREPRIRLRASINVGPLSPSDAPGGGNGTARNDTHRLLDSDAIRAAHDSGGHITNLTAIISQRVYEDVVIGGYSDTDSGHWAEVVAKVDKKSFAQRAWIYVPRPSGELLSSGIASLLQPPDSGANLPSAPNALQHVGTGVAFTGHVAGNFAPNIGFRPKRSSGE